ncbi:chemotaxis protein CheW [Clostridium fallax]|uniref:Purine-binding chemotaxis protein CheW n=1 Tax=Clostridium fallax TaxID=1533 RepID=A0A1M4UM94_9CLOT|nr:chemotaxis protein CheW [Clostridium fallax]SHE57881.1 purine-binding chemotaxis protein CheW [Clostridium fallax]SQB07644.1 chemotaxis protein cheW [Clostridium fallax]
MQVVVFKLGNEHFAIETSIVQAINDMMKVTRVPKAPDYIKGLINLRGNIISLLDINLLMGVKSDLKEQENIIIVNIQDEQVGISVDQVDEVFEVSDKLIKKFDERNEKPYRKGVINLNDQIITLLDTEKLLIN